MIAGGFGLFLERALGEEGFTVKRRGKPSSGLARPDFFDWPREAERLVARHRHDAAIVMFGGNDVQGLRMPDRSWIRWQDEGWSREYAARVAKMCEILRPQGQRIFWIGMPIVRPPKMRGRVLRVNTIFRAEMAIRKQAHFVETWDRMAGPDGDYAERLVVKPPPEGRRGKRVRVRADDGVHLTTAGAHFLKDHVRAAIVRILSGGDGVAGAAADPVDPDNPPKTVDPGAPPDPAP